MAEYALAYSGEKIDKLLGLVDKNSSALDVGICNADDLDVVHYELEEQIEQLNNKTMMEFEDINVRLENVERQQISASKDYIIERLTWVNPINNVEAYNVEKWASGFCRATGRVDYSTSIILDETWGELYYKSVKDWALPPYFTEISYANVSTWSGGGLLGASIYNISNDLSTFSFYIHDSMENTVTPTVFICFEGKWN